ncbi:hypothetical protein LT20_04791 [Pseudomonas aeruginosa]|nr:hypothetical protein LT20_04791 [Pseudomonas aeruginosa]
MAVGHPVQLVAAARRQIEGRPAVGDHQRQHLAQGQALGGESGLAVECLADLPVVGAVPDPQAIGQAGDLAVARRRRQRHRVEVGEHDVLARGEVGRAFAIAAYAGREHLPQLVADAAGAPFGRVAVFLDLGRQGAAAGGVRAEAEHLADLRQRRLGEATPVHRRVEVGAFVIEQVAVLDEQQALHHQRRQAGEVRVAPLRIAEVVDRHAAAIGDVQPGLGLFRVGREQPVFGVAHQCRGEVRLAGDGVVAVVQALHERRQQLVAEAAVEGAVRREQDGLAGTLAHLVVQGRGIACQLACLQPRGVRFVKYHDAHRGEDRQGEADQHQALAETAFLRRSGGRETAGLQLGRVVRGSF